MRGRVWLLFSSSHIGPQGYIGWMFINMWIYRSFFRVSRFSHQTNAFCITMLNHTGIGECEFVTFLYYMRPDLSLLEVTMFCIYVSTKHLSLFLCCYIKTVSIGFCRSKLTAPVHQAIFFGFINLVRNVYVSLWAEVLVIQLLITMPLWNMELRASYL